MKMSKNIQDNKFRISIDRNHSIEDLKEWNVTVKKVLLLLKEKKGILITITPQSYSIGEDLGRCQKIKRNKSGYLLNWDVYFSEDYLYLIAESEEFKRGLLFIVLSENITDIFKTIEAINPIGIIDLSQITVEIIFLEDDGETIFWNRPSKEIKTYLLNI